MNLNYSHLANCSNLALVSWNIAASWEYRLFVDERALDANLWLSAIRGCFVVATVSAPPAVVALSSTRLTVDDVLLPLRRVLVSVILEYGTTL